MADEFDVVCLGGGVAGEALTAQLKGSGLTLAVVERSLVGGECPYWGCIPSKTLLRSAEVLAEAGRSRELATSRTDWDLDFPKIAKRTSWMARDLDDSGAAKALQDEGATLFRGEGTLMGAREVAIGERRLRARRAVVVATGTTPVIPKIEGIEAVEVWTNREAVLPKQLPESMIVVGSGAVGAELAQAFARFGTRVRVLEASDRIIAGEEPEASAALLKYFLAEGIEVTTSARVSRVEREGTATRVHLASGESFSAERLLVATGRSPNLAGFELEAAGVKTTERGFLEVDPATLSAGDGVFGAGDVTGLGGFTHLAYYHGTLIGKRLTGNEARADHSAVPRVTFTDPEVAAVGMSERRARESGIQVRVATADAGNTARGYIHGEPGGVVKLVADEQRQVLIGATVVSPRAGEMLSELALAVRAQVPLPVMNDLMHPFPTFSRVLQGLFAELV